MHAVGMKTTRMKARDDHMGKVVLTGNELYTGVKFEDPNDAALSKFRLSYVCDIGFKGKKKVTIENFLQFGKSLFNTTGSPHLLLKPFDEFRVRTMTIDPHRIRSNGMNTKCFDYELMKLNFISCGDQVKLCVLYSACIHGLIDIFTARQ
jgi:hypothetical protein